jgi:hypothetical protein
MPAQGQGVILVGFDRTDNWGSTLLRPTRSFYLVDFAAPVIFTEGALVSAEVEFPGSMILRVDPADVAHDIAYFMAAQFGPAGVGMFCTDQPPKPIPTWPVDPREDDFSGSERRTKLHANVRETVSNLHLRLEVVRFNEWMLGDETIEVMRDLGFAIDVFEKRG